MDEGSRRTTEWPPPSLVVRSPRRTVSLIRNRRPHRDWDQASTIRLRRPRPRPQSVEDVRLRRIHHRRHGRPRLRPNSVTIHPAFSQKLQGNGVNATGTVTVTRLLPPHL
ncbi:phosphatidylinositol N-acetylglucosaminyltransferase subunit P-like [Panicum miliaceum]|uniref:Phosphatidylinositol N-acetylglucosaminyltransferase subunit P-like n=1 Tax=Panicum miliaceum TaxID=4540 RepID=A0A3L6Q8N7_PANMI|nr:phosphatidylinositol N-acetylglucosaminyltransferase subunit P-like [Panicum miliaceum]